MNDPHNHWLDSRHRRTRLEIALSGVNEPAKFLASFIALAAAFLLGSSLIPGVLDAYREVWANHWLFWSVLAMWLTGALAWSLVVSWQDSHDLASLEVLSGPITKLPTCWQKQCNPDSVRLDDRHVLGYRYRITIIRKLNAKGEVIAENAKLCSLDELVTHLNSWRLRDAEARRPNAGRAITALRNAATGEEQTNGRTSDAADMAVSGEWM